MAEANDLVRWQTDRKREGAVERLTRHIHSKNSQSDRKVLHVNAEVDHTTSVKKVRLNVDLPEFKSFVETHLWDNREALGYPYRGVSACDFFSKEYAKWLEIGYISQRDLRELDPSLEARMRKAMSMGTERPCGLVTENEAQILDIKDEFEMAVERQVRERARRNQQNYRDRKKQDRQEFEMP